MIGWMKRSGNYSGGIKKDKPIHFVIVFLSFIVMLGFIIGATYLVALLENL